jgi:hypothetical protein
MNKYSVIRYLSLLVIFFSASQSLAIMVGLTTEELTKGSEIVVMGDVEDVQSQWSADGKTIFTSASVLITEAIRGITVQTRIAVEYEGGEVGDIGFRVSDVAGLDRGENVILFLKSGTSKKNGIIYNVVGKGQGKYTVGSDRIARKKDFTLATGQEVVDNDIPVSALIEKIRRVK